MKGRTEYMQTVGDIFELLCGLAPLETKYEGDNPGLLVGRQNAEVTRVMVALDILPEVILEAEKFGAQLIVSHHPVIYRPMRAADGDDATGERVLMLAERGMAAVCMHTNLDRAEGGVASTFCRTLGLEPPDGGETCGVIEKSDDFVRIGALPEPMNTRAFAEYARDRLHANNVRYADAGREVRLVAAGSGSCGKYAQAAKAAGADTLIVGDAGYHDMRDALMLGINLVDAGHFPTEDPVCAELIKLICGAFPELIVKKSESLRDAWYSV